MFSFAEIYSNAQSNPSCKDTLNFELKCPGLAWCSPKRGLEDHALQLAPFIWPQKPVKEIDSMNLKG